MKKIWLFFCVTVLPIISGCDLQPKITSLPDSVGDFIAARYPTLLADPNAQPEIYNSAASDYGVYASPQLYGSVDTSDYVTYASVDDYIVPPTQSETTIMYGTPPESVPVTNDAKTSVVITQTDAPTGGAPAQTTLVPDDYLTVPEYNNGADVAPAAANATITVARGDTLYSLAQQYATTPEALANKNNLDMSKPLQIGQKLYITQSAPRAATASAVPSATPATPKNVPTTTRVQLTEITVGAGDTLYSLSRKYSVPVNDLAVMNNISAPFTLSVGQKLKVPNLASAPVRGATTVAPQSPARPAQSATPAAKTTQQGTTATIKTPAQTKPAKQKISSDPTKKLPAIAARSSSKFSWPVRGKILSHYGAKSGGLFNDGINISAARGTAVKAAENGVVAYAGNEVKGMGNLVIIQHSGGWMTVYAHMDSMAVRRGARVSVGQKIGTVGATGKVDKPQLHFEIRKGTKAYNPSSYLR